MRTCFQKVGGHLDVFLSKALSKVTQSGLKQGAKSLMRSASTTATGEPGGTAYRAGNTHQQITALSRIF